MNHSTTEVTCKSCNKKYYGVLNGIFNASTEYAATCPSCNEQTFLRNQTGIIDSEIPDGAVTIMPAKVLS